MSLVEFMTAARQRVENGWHQGALTDWQGNVCAVGALYEDLFDMAASPYVIQGHELLNDAAYERGYMSAAHFNDDLNTTRDDVLGMFDKVIEALG